MAGLMVSAEAAWEADLKPHQITSLFMTLSVSHTNGEPVTGLADTNVAVWDIGGLAPAGYAVGHDILDFQAVQPGLGGATPPEGVYSFRISTVPLGPKWINQFMFPLVVEVTDGPNQGRTMFKIRW
jgi:hypothetical protein